jgi:hypothetical protein
MVTLDKSTINIFFSNQKMFIFFKKLDSCLKLVLRHLINMLFHLPSQVMLSERVKVQYNLTPVSSRFKKLDILSQT